MWWFLIAIFIVCWLLCAHVAEWRGRSGKLWFWLGAVFGPLALIALALLPERPETTAWR
jgi:hypothetical protein